MRERIYKALISRYNAEMEDGLLKIDLLLQNSASHSVLTDHTDITGQIDALLGKVANAEGKMAKLRRFYSTN